MNAGKGEPRQWVCVSGADFLLPTRDEECERKKKKTTRLLVNIFKSKHQGWVHGGRSPALPCECAVKEFFDESMHLLCVE